MQVSQAEKSYQNLRDKLTHGELPPGTRLVNRTLAEEFGVSVVPLREAINRLSSEGLIAQVPGAGAFVRQPDQQELDELCVLRAALESGAAAEAAQYITLRQLDQLESILIDWKSITASIRRRSTRHATKSQLERWMDNEEQFHEVLVAASRNRFFIKVAGEHRVISRVFDAERQDPTLLTIKIAEATCRNHRDLLKALRERDCDLARQLMSLHIDMTRRHLARLEKLPR
jgi:DNA-binding GntR family transcriptional regulator